MHFRRKKKTKKNFKLRNYAQATKENQTQDNKLTSCKHISSSLKDQAGNSEQFQVYLGTVTNCIYMDKIQI